MSSPARPPTAQRRRRRGRASVGVLALAVSLGITLLPHAPISAQEPPPEPETDRIWREFQADRSGLYNTLAPPFVDCFKRRDSAIDPLSPIFHGCLDWHSAVHAAYSHHALYRHTGAYAYLDLVEQQLSPGGVSLIPAEQVYVQAKAPDYLLTENPYGFGWFLILARERELATGEDDLRPLADFAADQLVTWFETRAANNDANGYVQNRAHPNYSWSLLNLDVWARHTNDAELLADVREFSRPLLTGGCNPTGDASPTQTGFMPNCLMRLAAVAHIWGAHVKDWVNAKLPQGYYVPPVTDPGGCHQGGLNFSRSYALYTLYRLTGRTELRDNYVELVRYHVSRPDLYIDPDYLGDPGYLCYSHWVAQFGVRSISESFEAAPTTPDATPPI